MDVRTVTPEKYEPATDEDIRDLTEHAIAWVLNPAFIPFGAGLILKTLRRLRDSEDALQRVTALCDRWEASLLDDGSEQGADIVSLGRRRIAQIREAVKEGDNDSIPRLMLDHVRLLDRIDELERVALPIANALRTLRENGAPEPYTIELADTAVDKWIALLS